MNDKDNPTERARGQAIAWPRRGVVVGAGTMGRGFAQILGVAGIDCVLVDRDESLGEEAVARSRREVRQAEEGGMLPAGSAARFEANVAVAPSIEEALDPGVRGGSVELVMEAVSEQAEVKRSVFAAVEAAADPTATILSNTSAIPIATLSGFFACPERFLGAHWFNPPQWVPAVEVIPGPDTSAAAIERVEGLLVALGKRPARVGDGPGFVGNRIQFAMFREACAIVEEGLATADEVDEVVRHSFGWRLPFLGPFLVADLAGLDVYEEIYRTLGEQLGQERFAVPGAIEELVAEGRLGAKAGGGFRDIDLAAGERLTAARDRGYHRLGAVVEGFEADTGASGSQADAAAGA